MVMATTDPLGVYLNDHLGGATAGCELAAKLAHKHSGTERGPFFAELEREIRADREVLSGLIERLGYEQDQVKRALGWVGEKLSRLKLTDRLTGSPGLGALLEAEALSLGIEGKARLWRSLQHVAAADSRLAGADFGALFQRAERQREGLERHRLEFAAAALTR